MDSFVGSRDNVNPALLLNNDANFSDLFDSSSFPQTPQSQSENVFETVDPFLKGKNGRKRKRTQTDSMHMNELLSKKWEKDEERYEQEKKDKALLESKIDERIEKQEKREEELLSYMKMAAEAIVRMASKAD